MSRSRLSALAGWLGVAAFSVASIASGAAYVGRQGEAYSPLTHFISELGEPGVSTLAFLFDVGLIAGGACLAVFMVGLSAQTPGAYRYVIAFFGGVAGVAGSLVGVFPMTASEVHAIVALVFFLAAWLVVGAFTAHLLVGPSARFPRWLAIPGSITVLAFPAFLLDTWIETNAGAAVFETPAVRPDLWSMPTLEWATLISIVAWVAVVATRQWVPERASGPSHLAETGAAVAGPGRG